MVVIQPNGDATISGPADSNALLVTELRDALQPALLPTTTEAAAAMSSLAVLRVQLVHERWLTKAKLATAMRAAGSFDTAEKTAASLATLGLTAHDLPVLQFWSASVRSALCTLEARAREEEQEQEQEQQERTLREDSRGLL